MTLDESIRWARHLRDTPGPCFVNIIINQLPLYVENDFRHTRHNGAVTFKWRYLPWAVTLFVLPVYLLIPVGRASVCFVHCTYCI